jgi:hypothetical protein
LKIKCHRGSKKCRNCHVLFEWIAWIPWRFSTLFGERGQFQMKVFKKISQYFKGLVLRIRLFLKLIISDLISIMRALKIV